MLYRERLLSLTDAPAPALEALKRLSTYKDAKRPASVRTLDVFKKAPALSISLPLNRKTTENEVKIIPLGELEPKQEFIPVQGLAAYINRSRRDPPDVAHLKFKDGRERWVIQEGHTRLGAAVLRGESEREVRLWEFIENDEGGFDPVPRGLHKRGLTYRDKLIAASIDPWEPTAEMDKLDPEWQLLREGLCRKFKFENRRACASFISDLMADAQRANHHPDISTYDCDVTVTYVTHQAGDTITQKDFDGAMFADRAYAATPGFDLGDRSKYPGGLYPGEKEETEGQKKFKERESVERANSNERKESAQARLKERKVNATVINMPDIADVKGPEMVGAIPSKPPRKKRKPVTYKGVRLSRAPMAFEMQVLSLSDIPPRLDRAVESLISNPHTIAEVVFDISSYGAQQVLLELHRQGAPALITEVPVPVSFSGLLHQILTDRDKEIVGISESIARRLERRLSGDRLDQWTRDLVARRMPALEKRYANRAVNDAFSLGRATAINMFKRKPEPFSLAHRDEAGKFESLVAAVNGGDVLIDAVVQVAILDKFTCEECEEVDGEVMDFGDDRQEALHPPYVKCLGGDHCRCVQIALLDNGKEINVDEIDPDTID